VFVDRVLATLAHLRHDLPHSALAEGYRGLANQFPQQVTAPRREPKRDATLGEQHAWRHERRAQSADRICVEHANAEYKQWRPLQRYTGRREDFAETHAAIAGLVSDRSARRATRRKTSKELVLAADPSMALPGPPAGRLTPPTRLPLHCPVPLEESREAVRGGGTVQL
jgi:hypothetical protein